MSETQAFLIHQRPFKENDTIAQLLTERYGLISVYIKANRSHTLSAQHLRSSLQVATLLEIDVSLSNASLSKLNSLDSISITPPINNLSFVYLSYINEITRLFLNEFSVVSDVYTAYQSSILAILKAENEERAFRCLELALIKASRLSFSFEVDSQGDPIDESHVYLLDLEQGFIQKNHISPMNQKLYLSCSGDVISRLHLFQIESCDNIFMKRLFNLSKHYLYPNHALKSRDLYRALKAF